MDDWRDIEGKSGCYCVICHAGVMVLKYLQDMADRGDEAAKRLLDMLREEPDE